MSYVLARQRKEGPNEIIRFQKYRKGAGMGHILEMSLQKSRGFVRGSPGGALWACDWISGEAFPGAMFIAVTFPLKVKSDFFFPLKNKPLITRPRGVSQIWKRECEKMYQRA
jgi:hypothetical protein